MSDMTNRLRNQLRRVTARAQPPFVGVPVRGAPGLIDVRLGTRPSWQGRRDWMSLWRHFRYPKAPDRRPISTRCGGFRQTPFGASRPSGRAGGTRTPDPRIRNPMLYPAELLPHQVARQAREGGTKNDRIRKLKDENGVGGSANTL